MEVRKFVGKFIKYTEQLLYRLDRAPLWILGFMLVAINLAPCLVLGQGSVFPYHDQLDETILSYVLTGKYLGTGVKIFPEMMGGISASGMQPSAVLFVLLYRMLPVFAAFLTQWTIVLLSGFLGMYFCAKEITESSILATVSGGLFCMLPHMPIYGLSVAGVPILFCCFIWLYKEKKLLLSFLLLLYFGLTTHLVLIGYAVLGLWLPALVGMILKRKKNRRGRRWLWLGFGWLTVIYLVVNHALFSELLFGNSSYTSHREELVNQPMEFWSTVREVFFHSAQHAASLHKYLILPVLAILCIGGFLYRKMDREQRDRYLAAWGGMILLMFIAVFYGFCHWKPVVDLKNSQTGFLRYFQAERLYWLYPAGWYLEFILCVSLWWNATMEGKLKILNVPLLKLLVLVLVLLPTWQEVKVNSYLYMNVNQINNGSGITGYISWESYYAEDLMQILENVIDRDMDTYRIAHLGMSPAPALMHGFYTVDGYSNNYSMEYKHRFRQVISKELEKDEQTRLYFDQWGSRCYLFNGSTGSTWMLGKTKNIVYESLDFDMAALKALGCEYLFSCGEIKNADELGLSLRGYYETESSYWGVWLYEL